MSTCRYLSKTISREKTYSVAPFSHALVTGSLLPRAVIHFSQVFVSTAVIPDYFAGNRYENPSSALDSPLTFGLDCKGTNYFEFLARPEKEQFVIMFNETMAVQRLNEELEFVASYPIEDRRFCARALRRCRR